MDYLQVLFVARTPPVGSTGGGTGSVTDTTSRSSPVADDKDPVCVLCTTLVVRSSRLEYEVPLPNSRDVKLVENRERGMWSERWQ